MVKFLSYFNYYPQLAKKAIMDREILVKLTLTYGGRLCICHLKLVDD